MTDSLFCGHPYIYRLDGDAYTLKARGVHGGCALQDVDGSTFYVPQSCVDDTFEGEIEAMRIWEEKSK